MSEATKSAHWPRILNGWLIDEEPWKPYDNFPDEPAITATHLLSGVRFVWRDKLCVWKVWPEITGIRMVVLEHPALKPRTLTQEMGHDEALHYIETTVLGD